MPQNKTIAFPHSPGAGGPGSFQKRFENELKKNNWTICYAEETVIPNVIFIVGGTKKIVWLWKLKRQGIPIVFRLDGINWLHKKKKVSLKDYCSAELSNLVLKFIHAFFANKIIYQSQFVKDWWRKEGWRNKVSSSIINNGVTVQDHSDVNKDIINRTIKRLVVLEGVIDYTPYAVELLNKLAQKLPKEIQIEVYGKFENNQNKNALDSRLLYKGFIKPEEVPNILSGAVYFSLDINPACPNTVIEALASGAPVVAFNTGAIPELLDDTCGKIVPYGSNPWDLKFPDVDALAKAIEEVLVDYDKYSKHAYQKAKTNFDIKIMFKNYESILNECTTSTKVVKA